MTMLKDIPTENFPLTRARYRELKAEIIEAAEGFEYHGHPDLASDFYKIADALDVAMSKVIEAEATETPTPGI